MLLCYRHIYIIYFRLPTYSVCAEESNDDDYYYIQYYLAYLLITVDFFFRIDYSEIHVLNIYNVICHIELINIYVHGKSDDMCPPGGHRQGWGTHYYSLNIYLQGYFLLR